MIVPTGEIRFATISGGGFVRGIPVKPTATLGDPIPANIRRTRRQVYDTGTQAWVTREGYTVLVEADTPGTDNLKRVALTDSRGHDLGEFEVTDVQYLDQAGVIQITI